MKINARHREGITVLDPKGKITIGEGDVQLREAVSGALEAGSNKILINLQGVSSCDSSGIGEMVAAFTTVKNRGGELKLCALAPKVTDVLQITQLITVFEIYDTEDEAIASF